MLELISINAHGRTYSGSYLLDSRIVAVSSAYGSNSVKISKGEGADEFAKKLLAEVVEVWSP